MDDIPPSFFPQIKVKLTNRRFEFLVEKDVWMVETKLLPKFGGRRRRLPVCEQCGGTVIAVREQ
ncbi:hypothetical protein RchiOBHm_Chr5g0024771 [Rosa chinensis]|uniref:Uncharacterized protein n=1 Tax=Rosa chinensis TaxID=74649 RepID=A0A2P6Q8E8_ROSCH|nr:hypothetical protein RchiOBHm_Chr5g0024771 [Rosa chinensis]